MKFFFMFTIILNMMLGLPAIIFSYFFYKESKAGFIKYYIALLFTSYMVNIFNIFEIFYRTKSNIYSKLFNTIGTGIIEFSHVLIAVLWTLLLLNISKISLKSFYKILILFSFLVFLIHKLIFFFIKTNILYSKNILANNDFGVFVHFFILFLIFITYRSLRKQINKVFKNFIRYLLLLAVSCFLLEFMLNMIVPNLNTGYLLSGFFDFQLPFIFLNIAGLFLGFRYAKVHISVNNETLNDDRVTIEKDFDIEAVTENTNDNLRDYNLTNREIEITNLILKGLTNKEISEELFISLSTVKTHIYNIYQKFGIKNRTELKFLLKKNDKEDNS